MTLCFFSCMPDSNPKYVSLFHYLHGNVCGTWLTKTLESNRIDGTVYNFTVYFKCLYSIPFFLKKC